MSQKRPRSQEQLGEGEDEEQAFFHSQKIEDRASTFMAIYTPSTVTPPKQVQSHPSIADASHRILAWRKPGRQHTLPVAYSSSQGAEAGKRVLYDSGHDDDGESYAGKKLENLLWNLDVAGTLVVGRWYGGVLLGPVRFEHIVSVAREAIKEWKTQGEEMRKRRKVEEEQEKEKVRLAGVLKERDRSIEVLRGLLAEKKGEKERGGTEGKAVKIDYGSMGLETLKRLERARDSTIKWILGQIDKIEEEQKTSQQNGDDLTRVADPAATTVQPEAGDEDPQQNEADTENVTKISADSSDANDNAIEPAVDEPHLQHDENSLRD